MVTVVKYQSYLFDLSSFSGVSKERPRKAKERSTLELLTPDPDDPVYKAAPGRFRSQIHERFAEMLWPFAYVFMILAFAGQARSSRQSFGASISAATMSVVIARGLGFSSITSLKTDPSAVTFVYVLPIACIVFGAWFVVTNRPATLPKSAVDRIDRQMGAAAERMALLRERYRQYQRRRAGVGA